jgi:organic hydroperoxide reductase OsmC/OhrA
MSSYQATVHWQRGDAEFSGGRYSRGHIWHFDGGIEVRASSSPQVVPPPRSIAEAVDPEEAFVVSLSSCHMLWFLSIAASAGLVVDSYHDEAIGTLAKNAEGRLAMTKVVLRPRIAWGGAAPSAEQLAELHERAHHECFLASSVKTEIVVEPVA